MVGFIVTDPEENFYIRAKQYGGPGEPVYIDGEEEEVGRVSKMVYSYVKDVNNGYMYAKARLYRLTIYDNGAKVRDYVPVVENGVAGLRDLAHPDGALLTAKGLTVSGRGHDGAEEWIVTPQGCTLKKDDPPATLTALAVGAVSYRWKKNGQPVSGGANGSLDVAWAKGGATDLYSVIPVYSVFGEEVEGAAVQVSVTSAPLGMMIILR
jgi:hypothetical protein